MKVSKAGAKTKARVKLNMKARKAAWEHNIPPWDILEYKKSLVKTLNFFNIEVDDKLKQGWCIAYWKAQKKDIKGLSGVREGRFRQAGVLVKLLEMNIPIESNHMDYLDNKYKELMYELKVAAANEAEIAEVKKAPRLGIQDYINAQASVHVAEISAALDAFCFKGTDFDTKAYLKGNQVNSVLAKRIGNAFQRDLTEFQDVVVARERADDLKKMKIKEDCMTPEQVFAVDMNSQLVEGYSRFGTIKLRHIIQFIEKIISDCAAFSQVVKVTKAPRQKKEKPAAVLVAKLKWLPEFTDLGLKSVRPEKIVVSDALYLYDTIKRRIIRYIAQDGKLLSVKGGSIMNFDPVKSGSKILRKPEVQLKGVVDMSKRPINEWYNTINSTQGVVRGRVSADSIILNVL